jgi:hypothetical protein
VRIYPYKQSAQSFKADSLKLSAKTQARFLVGEDLSLQAKRKKFKAVSFK